MARRVSRRVAGVWLGALSDGDGVMGTWVAGPCQGLKGAGGGTESKEKKKRKQGKRKPCAFATYCRARVTRGFM